MHLAKLFNIKKPVSRNLHFSLIKFSELTALNYITFYYWATELAPWQMAVLELRNLDNTMTFLFIGKSHLKRDAIQNSEQRIQNSFEPSKDSFHSGK